MLTREMIDDFMATDEIEPLVRGLLQAGERAGRLQLSASWVDAEDYWLTFGPAGQDELAEVTNEACLEILAHRYRQLLGDVVFAYRESGGAERAVYLIFDTRMGAWCPYVPVPAPGGAEPLDRDLEFERQLWEKLKDALPATGIATGWFPFREPPF